MRVLIAAGGTGGHIYPGITVAQTLLARDPKVDVLFVGRANGLEAEIVPRLGFPFETVPAAYLQRKLSLSVLKTGWTSIRGLKQSLAIIKRFRPDVALGTGGYVSGPVIAAAKLSNVPTVIQEADAFPGLTSRLLGRFVDIVALGTEQAAPHFSGAKRVEITGNPIRTEIVERSREEGYKALRLDPKRKTVLLFGGSQGGATLNRAMQEAARSLLETGVQIVWQTGSAAFREAVKAMEAGLPRKSVQRSVDTNGSPIRFGHLHMLPFIDDMASAYAAADVVVCRAGAITLAELTARGLPAILIPYPHAAQNHQMVNARVVEQAGGARVIEDEQLTAETLLAVLKPLMADSDSLKQMAAASRSLGRPDAAARIADLILQSATGAGRRS